MKTKLHTALRALRCALALLSAFSFPLSAFSQTTAFTYQGRLNDGANPASGIYDLRFALYDAAGGGSQQGGTLTNTATPVSNGLFTVTLDFGNQFPGADRWLELGVRTNGGGAFAALTPRQAISSVPYASRSASASSVDAGTVVNPGFIGTTNATALDFYVNNQRALQLQYPSSGSAPNLVGGSSSNSVGLSTEGAVVGGGGSTSLPNTVGTDSDFSFVGGGRGNNVQAGAWQATIGGGVINTIGTNASFATIAGGQMNQIAPSGVSASIGGGQNNRVGTDSTAATIAGGYLNTISNNAGYTVIAGGYQNIIGTGDSFSIIGGGNANAIGGGSTLGLIAGGGLNRIESNTFAGTIAGGTQNQIGTGSSGAAILGGNINVVSSNSPHGTILGGQYNGVGPESDFSIISGGYSNAISVFSDHSNIGGGQKNTIASTDAVIAGGSLNDIGAAAFNSAIGGGQNNNIGSGSPAATIGGGYENNIGFNSGNATIAGGHGGSIGGEAPFTAVGGGFHNSIGGNATYSVIGGGRYNQILTDAQDATISGGSYHQIGVGSFRATIAGGSVGIIGSNSPSAVVGGGTLNQIGPASASAAILGGQSNKVGSNAPYATVLGGGNNSVADNADRALAAGYGAKANHPGSFVWADSQLGDFASTGANQFNVRAGGGVRFVTSGAGMTLDGQPVLAGVNGGSLTNLNASQLSGGTVPATALTNAWKIGGNVGTTPGTHFLGSLDNQPLEFKVNNQRALRLEYASNFFGLSMNVIGGFPGNSVGSGLVGAVIAGGGNFGNPHYVGGNYATVVGGLANTASGLASTAMGTGTIASGMQSTAMGRQTTASGDYSTAMGYRAKANHQGTFVWADSFNADFASSADNQFLIRANGGVGINTTLPQAPLHVSGRAIVNGADQWDVNNTEGDFRVGSDTHRFKIGVAQGGGGAGDVWMRAQGGTARLFLKTPGGTTIYSNEGQTSGVSLAPGGTAWAVVSDRSVKKDFAAIDAVEVLEKLAALPITQWRYQWENAETTPHIGPMAQDFKAAFYPGTDDKSITTLEADGVTFAAIQGLNQKLSEEIGSVRAENAELKARLEKLEQLLNNQLNQNAK